ncbi:MAG: hypothetical protein OES26_08920 [Gammaproteobacteria bacterium]|nr:hypothetical protein [Gammaproteobacteria bacterium]
MNRTYYDTIKKLESDGVNNDYVLGWASGYLGNPKLEEQRITDAYDAGYEDGLAKNTENADAWKGSPG